MQRLKHVIEKVLAESPSQVVDGVCLPDITEEGLATIAQQLQHTRFKAPPDMPLARDDGVLYVEHIRVGDSFEVGTFHMPPGATIPLHNHPWMSAASKVLYGSAKVRILNWCDGERDGMATMRIVDARPPQVLTLGPKRDNLHEITALQGGYGFVHANLPAYSEHATSRNGCFFEMETVPDESGRVLLRMREPPSEYVLRTLEH